MRRLFAIAVLVALVAAAPAAGIVFGEPDEGRHPNVGLMMAGPAGGAPDPICTGTLVSARLVLTAAHCVVGLEQFYGPGFEVFVTFADDWGANPTLVPGAAHAYPGFTNLSRSAKDIDIGVIVLDRTPVGVTPASLPDEGLVDGLDLKKEWFTAVGYGAVRDDKTNGPRTIFFDTIRRMSTQRSLARNDAWMLLSMNPSTGNGGTCFGDSGGPHFLRDTDIVLSVTSTGDRWCRATDWTARVDTKAALDFVTQFIDD
jgi:hypothetical protein